MTLLILLALAIPQDDPQDWIVRLGSATPLEREEAARRLQALGEAGLERLELAREDAGDVVIKARLGAVIVRIRTAAELTKVFGPAPRVTIAARGWLLKDILSRLRLPGIAGVDAGVFDAEAKLDLQIRDVTWWEALDRACEAAGARHSLESLADGRTQVSLARGAPLRDPVLYVDRFRIMVSQTNLYEGNSGKAASVIVEARHTPDLKPGGRSLDSIMKFESVLDAKGKEVRIDRPAWGERKTPIVGPLATRGLVWVRPDATEPLTVIGTTDIPFAKATREISLDLEGARSVLLVGDVQVRVESFKELDKGPRMTIRAEGENIPDLADRLDTGSVILVDGEGRRHAGSVQAGGGGTSSCRWDFEFSTGIRAPRLVILRWVTEFHRVRIPFRLEGVTLPGFK